MFSTPNMQGNTILNKLDNKLHFRYYTWNIEYIYLKFGNIYLSVVDLMY